MARKEKTLRLQNIRRWDEGIPLGCGKMGALLYGSDPLIVSLDRADLWDLTPPPEYKDPRFKYALMADGVRKASDEESFQRAISLFDTSYSHKTPTKIKAGRFLIEGLGLKPSFFLDYGRGEATVSGIRGSALFFLSQADFIGAVRSSAPLRISFEAPAVLFGEGGLGYPPLKESDDGGIRVWTISSRSGFAFSVLLAEREADGSFEAYFDVASSSDGPDYLAKAEGRLRQLLRMPFDSLRERNADWWASYWAESSVSIPEASFQKAYDLSSYFLASASRKGCPPMPLQGVWTADDGGLPPWKGDYHNDLNTEMCYGSYLKTNHLKEGEAWLDFLFGRKPMFEKVAKDIYCVDGLLVPGVMDYLGRPLGGWPLYSFSPAMSIFAVKGFDDYWRYTGDEAFFRERAYPMLMETGEAIRGLLKKENGRYVLPVSSSPELHDNTLEAVMHPISNCDLALLRYLFRTLSGYAEKAGEDPSQYEEILDGLGDYFVDEDGSFMIDSEENYDESHRHFSHLFMVYPLNDVTSETKEGRAAIEASLARIVGNGTQGYVGFSFPWEASLALKAKKRELAYADLSIFLDGFVGRNGFHLNGDFKNRGYSGLKYRPFTLEANMGFQETVGEMLLDEEGGKIALFKGVPEGWARRGVSFSNLRAEGGYLVSASLKRNAVTSLTVRSPRDAQVTFAFPDGSERAFHLKEGVNILVAEH
jgi:alpha-L-fucosidase 2